MTVQETPKHHVRPTSNARAYELGGPMAWWVWALAVTFVVYLFSFQTGYAIVNSRVQTDVGLSIEQVGTIAAVYTWAFAICQFFGGSLLDRLGSRAVLPIAIALVTLGIFVFANATSYPMLLVSQIIIAAGSCVGFVGAGYIGGQWFGMAKFSFMFGLVQVVAALTSAFSQNLINVALSQTDWRTLFNATAVFGIILFILGLLYIRNPSPVPEAPSGGVTHFFSSVVGRLMEVAKIRHVWIAALAGATTFGAMLALGVVWMPKLLKVHGLSEASAFFGASLLWLGLAAGSALIPHWSDVLRTRRMPMILGAIAQLAVAVIMLNFTLGTTAAYILCFIFGFANATHMLAFSTAADVVEPSQIGTSAAIVNGIMFILGGILMSRPGARIGMGLEQGLQPGTLEAAQFVARPIVLALIAGLILAFLMKETYPTSKST